MTIPDDWIFVDDCHCDRCRQVRDAGSLARARMIRHNRLRSRFLRDEIANRRAHALLVGHLTAAQREQLEREGRFVVESPAGRAFVLYNERVMGVRFKSGPALLDRYGTARPAPCYLCIHLPGDVPVADNLLAQKLLIDADEADFLAKANL